MMWIDGRTITFDKLKQLVLPAIYTFEFAQVSHAPIPSTLSPSASSPKSPSQRRKRSLQTPTKSPARRESEDSTSKESLGESLQSVASWVPIYVSECSYTTNQLFDDQRLVVVTDSYIHVTTPIVAGKQVKIHESIKLESVVDVSRESRYTGFDCWAFPHVIIKYHAISRPVENPKRRVSLIPGREFSMLNSVSTLVLRTSMKSWRIVDAIQRALVNCFVRVALSRTIYTDKSEVRIYDKLEEQLLKKGLMKRSEDDVEFASNLRKKGRMLKELENLGSWNRLVKAAFCKSMRLYKFIFDEAESGFLIIKDFTDEKLKPTFRRRSKAEIAAMVGLNRDHPRIAEKQRISEQKCIAAIKYVRKCIKVLKAMIMDAEQIEERRNIFMSKSPYGFQDLIKMLIASIHLELKMREPENIPKSKPKPIAPTPAPTGLLDLLQRLENGIDKDRQLHNVPVLHVLLPPPTLNAWSRAPIRAVPTQRNKQWNPLDARLEFVKPEDTTLRTLFTGEAPHKIDFEEGRRRVMDEIRFTSDYRPYRRGRKGGMRRDELRSEREFEEVEAWEARWPMAKTRSCLSSNESESSGERSLKLRKGREDSEEEDDGSDVRMGEDISLDEIIKRRADDNDKWDFYKRILALPLPDDLVSVASTHDEDTYSIRHHDQDDHILSRFINQIPLSVDSPDASQELLSPTKRFNSDYPTAETFESTDVHARMPIPRLERSCEALRYLTLDTSILLWELCFLSRLDASASRFFDDFAVPTWVKSGGCDSGIGVLLASFHPGVHPSPGYLRVEEEENIHGGEGKLKKPPPIALVLLYKIVLLMKHCEEVMGSLEHLGIWEEEFKYLLSNKVVLRALDGDSRAIAQVVRDWISEGVSRFPATEPTDDDSLNIIDECDDVNDIPDDGDDDDDDDDYNGDKVNKKEVIPAAAKPEGTPKESLKT
ncbi:hypothetical protein HDV05_001426 [Chytridiales sp. JEL 0842]|nr:hypothetical protein HDV05_001426 [Chytridiales sp. JEL 0842]